MSVQQAEVDLIRDESLKMVALCQKHTNYLADKAKLQNKYGDLQSVEKELNETSFQNKMSMIQSILRQQEA